MKRLPILSIIAGAFAPVTGSMKQPRPRKPCLICGAMHTHNNAFCSAEHAAEYKKRNKTGGR